MKGTESESYNPEGCAPNNAYFSIKTHFIPYSLKKGLFTQISKLFVQINLF